MLLCVDIGNSSISLGIFENGNLTTRTDFGYNRDMSPEGFAQLFYRILGDKHFSECVVMSVADEMTSTICMVITAVFEINPILISHDMEFGLSMEFENPERIGLDRIANICAARKNYSGAVIVADFGTATTFDIMDGGQNFVGGLIMPGIGTQLKSLTDNTSKLPEVDLSEFEQTENVINSETKKAMLTGVIRGHAYAVEGLLNDCKKELKKKPVIIATGGYATLMAEYIKKQKFDVVDTNLTLYGIQEIYLMNS